MTNLGGKPTIGFRVVSARNVTLDDSSADQSAPDFCTSQVIDRIGFGGWCEYLDFCAHSLSLASSGKADHRPFGIGQRKWLLKIKPD
jgi:hypothetical protein